MNRSCRKSKQFPFQKLLKNNQQLQDDIKELQQNGYIILRDLLTPQELDSIYSKSIEILENVPFGRNDFEGHTTKRVYGIISK